MGFVVDDSKRPIVLVTWQGETTVDDVGRYAAWLDAEVDRVRVDGVRVAIVSDATGVTRVGAEARRAFSDRRRRSDPRDVVVGNWIVSHNALIRGITSAVRWVNPSLARVYMVKSLEQAMNEASAALAERT